MSRECITHHSNAVKYKRHELACERCLNKYTAWLSEEQARKRRFCSKACRYAVPSIKAKLLARRTIDKNGCWIWAGAKNDQGYGNITWNKKRFYVHRLAYEAFKHEIPKGLVIDHLCRARSCFNPEHLEVVSETENIRRGIPFRKKYDNGRKGFRATHCKRGHGFTEENTRYEKNRYGNKVRRCKICYRDNARASAKTYRERNKERINAKRRKLRSDSSHGV